VLIAAALLAFLFYTLSDAEEQMLKALAISGFVSIGVCLECGIGLFKKYRQWDHLEKKL
jgi:hypothetical protein